jgi:hypothetical protein
MISKRLAVAGVVSTFSCGFLLYLAGAAAQESDHEPAESKLETAARATFEATEALYNVGQTDLEDIYRWSRRWMDAELKVNPDNRQPRIDHWRRMKAVFERVAALQANGVAGGEANRFHAAEYFVEEAQLEAAE